MKSNQLRKHSAQLLALLVASGLSSCKSTEVPQGSPPSPPAQDSGSGSKAKGITPKPASKSITSSSRHSGDKSGQALEGKIGIIMVEMTDKPRMRHPSTSGDAYSDTASALVKAAAESGSSDPRGLILAPVLLAAAPVAGALSSLRGTSSTATYHAHDVISNAYAEADPCSIVKDRVVERLRQLGAHPVFIRREILTETNWSDRDAAYFSKLAERGIPTALVVEFWGHTFEGPERFDPKLTVNLRLDARLVKTSNGKTLRSIMVTHKSTEKEKYAHWAEAGGSAYKETLRAVGEHATDDLIARFTP
jgi:hypothetical protein